MAVQQIEIRGPDKAVEFARLALSRVLRPEEGNVTAASETQVQNALHLLRATACERAVVERFEQAAVQIRVLVEAKREGRINFYASKLARLRRTVAAW